MKSKGTFTITTKTGDHVHDDIIDKLDGHGYENDERIAYEYAKKLSAHQIISQNKAVTLYEGDTKIARFVQGEETELI